MNPWIKRLQEELAKPLPGADSWRRMAPSVRRALSKDKPLKMAGILILVYPVAGILHTVFIKRNEYNGIHSGQVSFPGGMLEKTDSSIEATALREAHEETGLNTDKVRILGKLTPLHIPASNIDAHPFVGAVINRPAFKPDPNEVQYLIELKLTDLLNPASQKKKNMVVAGDIIEVPYYDAGIDFIWGATAMILCEFLDISGRVVK
jgi:8-oxo-dGTP pyrophosphatase MutT (NUDIX family)